MNREITMSFSKFFKMERGEVSLNQIVKDNELECLATKIMRNPRLKKFCITTLALVNIYSKPAFAIDYNSRQSLIIGSSVINLEFIREVLIIVCILSFFIEIAKCTFRKDTQKMPKIVIKYILVVASTYSIEYSLHLISDIVTNL